MDQKLKGQIAVVTGASSGIGAGCSLELAKAGATVVVNYPIPQGMAMAEKVVEEIIADGGSAISYKCDVSKEDEVKQMFADVVEQLGTVDILMHRLQK
jgi:glucose 1-dehydrogenase